PGMVKAAICATSGMAPGPAGADIKGDWFTPDNVPKDICRCHKCVSVTLRDVGATVAGRGVPKEDTIERVFTFPPPQFKGWIGGGPPLSTTVGITQAHALPLPTPATEPPGVAQFITPVAAAPEPTAARPAGLSQPANLQPIPGLQLSITSPA